MATFVIYDDRYQWRRPRNPVAVYLRYGLWAGMRKSNNHSTGEEERGLSVYRAKLIDGMVYLDEEICPTLIGQGRLCFAVSGTEVGIGSDGEPLLKGVYVVPYPIALSAKV